MLFVTVWFAAGAKPLPKESGLRIIVDTDCAIDDFRALCLILSRPEIRIEAITLSAGSLSPNEGYQRVKNLLKAFGRDTIPVGVGKNNPVLQPVWRSFNQQISWVGDTEHLLPVVNADSLLRAKITLSPGKVSLVCLGGLTNLAGIAVDGTLAKNVRQVIWYSDYKSGIPAGFNYESDTSAAQAVLQSGVKLITIANLTHPLMKFDTALFAVCQSATTQTARIMTSIHLQPEVQQRLRDGHFGLYDELVAVYLTDPELYDITPAKDQSRHRYNRALDAQAIRQVITDMLTGQYRPLSGVVLRDFPMEPHNYAYDVRPIITEAVKRYGAAEWKAVAMTDEFHGHLGVFSIVGAKMGIRAREYFGVGYDELEVVSSAGSKPPYSCLNDGVQVSTGATLGMGTIRLSDEKRTFPSAVFYHDGQAIRLSLKTEYLARVDSDIREGIVKFGLSDDGYWKLVRRNALKYWLEWDRNQIFELEIVK